MNTQPVPTEVRTGCPVVLGLASPSSGPRLSLAWHGAPVPQDLGQSQAWWPWPSLAGRPSGTQWQPSRAQQPWASLPSAGSPAGRRVWRTLGTKRGCRGPASTPLAARALLPLLPSPAPNTLLSPELRPQTAHTGPNAFPSVVMIRAQRPPRSWPRAACVCPLQSRASALSDLLLHTLHRDTLPPTLPHPSP